MSEMIKRGAEAICLACYGTKLADQPRATEIALESWSRAVIESMRFPTLPMIVASGSLSKEDVTGHMIWKVMIEAALKK